MSKVQLLERVDAIRTTGRIRVAVAGYGAVGA